MSARTTHAVTMRARARAPVDARIRARCVRTNGASIDALLARF
jgi:hypothetical protein